MSEQNGFKRLLDNINTDPNFSKILIKLLNLTTEEEIDRIIRNIGLEIISKTYPSKDFLLYTLNIKDVREVALILTEQGFTVEGISALATRKEVRKEEETLV